MEGWKALAKRHRQAALPVVVRRNAVSDEFGLAKEQITFERVHHGVLPALIVLRRHDAMVAHSEVHP